MPIYEYQALQPARACSDCRRPFEVLHSPGQSPLVKCPSCGNPVRRVMSWCHSAVAETPLAQKKTEHAIKEYERSGMWSHAAELADKHAEKTKDGDLKMRALDNYRKAGYDSDTLARHSKISDD